MTSPAEICFSSSDCAVGQERLLRPGSASPQLFPPRHQPSAQTSTFPNPWSSRQPDSRAPAFRENSFSPPAHNLRRWNKTRAVRREAWQHACCAADPRTAGRDGTLFLIAPCARCCDTLITRVLTHRARRPGLPASAAKRPRAGFAAGGKSRGSQALGTGELLGSVYCSGPSQASAGGRCMRCWLFHLLLLTAVSGFLHVWGSFSTIATNISGLCRPRQARLPTRASSPSHRLCGPLQIFQHAIFSPRFARKGRVSANFSTPDFYRATTTETF